MTRKQIKSTRRTGFLRLSRTGWIILLFGLALLALIGLALWYHGRPVNKKVATIPSSTRVGKPANSQTGSKNNSTNNNPAPATTSPQASPSTPTTALIVPWGNFVSNHRPGENESPTTETSTCNTTPAATCYISFTNGSQTRTLDAKVASASGAVIWGWDVSTAGFGSGTWQIKAIATLNGQTKTASDSLPLVIQ